MLGKFDCAFFITFVYRTLTTAYKEKDTDNIKRVKSKVNVSKIQTAMKV